MKLITLLLISIIFFGCDNNKDESVTLTFVQSEDSTKIYNLDEYFFAAKQKEFTLNRVKRDLLQIGITIDKYEFYSGLHFMNFYYDKHRYSVSFDSDTGEFWNYHKY
jgi:hypothetical protein